jgi:hypothetical protein
MTNARDLSTEELKVELARREKEAQEAKVAKNAERRQRQDAALTKDVIDALAPEHGRTSCSDSNLANGWGSHSSGGARCSRCAMLDGGLPIGFHYTLAIESD